ncbi:MAG: efflux RND transporter permease subunit [Rhodospirillaceae bacterium]|nr:efflux RND transporter permease subunit [Rhodospirillaceae bacterium]
MNISAPFIARPVATWLLAFALMLGGLLGYRMLPVSALPEVDFPTIQVTTRLPGASAETMVSLVTTPLERQFGRIAGLQSMSSTSAYGMSAITLQFILTKSIDSAAEDVQAAINAANGVLPDNLPYPPSYAKVNPADPPILTLALTSDTLPATRLNDIVDTLLAQKLSQVSGVGRVQVQGGQRPAFRIQIDPARLASYGIGIESLRGALAKANANLPKGTLEGELQSLSVGSNDQITDIDQYAAQIIAWKDGAPVRVRDVGTVINGLEDTKVGGWFNGKPAVIVDVQRQPGANIVATADLVKERLPEVRRSIPQGVDVTILADRTATIRASVADVQFTLILTVGLVVMVIFLFLRSGRATVIPGVALPLSVVATFGVMSFLGFSLDNLSLMALTISAGFVVDDAIVMVENIMRYVEKGHSALKAAYLGAREIGFTVVSLTVSLVAVFIPLLFMSGIVGRLFREFALTLSIAVVISAAISLSLTPMMCAYMLRPVPPGEEAPSRHGLFERLLAFYEKTLTVVMRHQRATLILFLVTLAATILSYVAMPKGFLPMQDTGLIVATTDARQDISFPAMAALQAQAAEIVKADPDVTGVASFLGAGTTNVTANSGRMTIALKPKGERNASIDTIIGRLSRALASLPGLSVHMQAAQDIQIGARSSRTQYQFTLTDVDGERLAGIAPRIEEALKALPQLTDVASDQLDKGLQARIEVDRDQAGRLGVSMSSVVNTLYSAFGQRQISTIYSQVNQYRVILEATDRFRSGPEGLARLYVQSDNGTLVPLSSFARISLETEPLLVTHEGQFPSVTLSFNLASGVSLGEAVAAIEAAEAGLNVPDTVQGAFSGDAAEFRVALESTPLLILAALVVIYIVLGMLYESAIHPVTILSTLPSAGIGALLALLAAGQDLSLLGLIGIVLLMGIVKKNAIMMIDFALVAEREEGKPPDEAIFQACLLRFRPIMMTTLAALLGAIPLALDQGTGGELRRPLGIAIVGGLVFSQLLTLYTTPVIYLYMERVRLWCRRRARLDSPAAPARDEG